MLASREKKDVDSENAHQRLLGAWQSPDPAKRPSVSLFVDFILSLMAHADAALLQRLLSVRLAVSCADPSLMGHGQATCLLPHRPLGCVLALPNALCDQLPLGAARQLLSGAAAYLEYCLLYRCT